VGALDAMGSHLIGRCCKSNMQRLALLRLASLLMTGPNRRVSVATKMHHLLVLLSTSNLMSDHMYNDTYYTNPYQSVHMGANLSDYCPPCLPRCRVLNAACEAMSIFTTRVVRQSASSVPDNLNVRRRASRAPLLWFVTSGLIACAGRIHGKTYQRLRFLQSGPGLDIATHAPCAIDS
jgi:hypothetical protein